MSVDNLAARQTAISSGLLLKTGVIAPIVFVASVAVWGALTPGYSHISQYISELGARGAPFATPMNLLGIVPFGLLICTFAIGYARSTTSFAARWLTSGVLLLCGAGFVAAGLFACDQACSFNNMSTSAIVHNLSAMSAFLLAMLAVAASLCQRAGWRALLFGLVVLCSMLGAFWAMLKLGPTSDTIGLAQRAFLLPFCVWLAATAWRLGKQR